MRRLIALLLALALVPIAGCTKHPYFGTDMPDTPSASAARCDDQPSSIPAPPPSALPVAPPGKLVSMIQVTFAAVFFGIGPDNVLHCDLAVPVQLRIHLYATVDGVSIFRGPNGELLPYDGFKTTPWTTVFTLSHPAGTAPTVMIDASASIEDSPIAPAPQDATLHCIVRYMGSVVASDPSSPPLPRGNRFVRCNVTFQAPL